MEINAYLTFAGTCEAAFEFYLKHLGGEVIAKHSYLGSPMEQQCPAEWRDKIMHMCVNVAGKTLMGSDGMGECQTTSFSGFSLSVNTKDTEEADRIFAALAENGNITMPIAATFWARRFGMLTDQFGVPWMINCE